VQTPSAAFDPGPRIRHLIVLLLRSGLGMSLLNSGLFGYLGMGRGGVALVGGLRMPVTPDPAFAILPVVEIGLGMALLLGLFTTTAALVAGFLFLLAPLLQLILVLGSGFQGNPNSVAFLSLQDILAAGTTSNLLLVAAIMWLSPVGTNPWSLDSLLFARDEARQVSTETNTSAAAPAEEPAKGDDPPKEPPAPTPTAAPAPAPGERAAKFIANRGK
jgi:uncharacterized membrane protein YphA (DoxX/SURF4 family)